MAFPWPDAIHLAFQFKKTGYLQKRRHVEHTIINCHDLQSNESFVTVDSLFTQKCIIQNDYCLCLAELR